MSQRFFNKKQVWSDCETVLLPNLNLWSHLVSSSHYLYQAVEYEALSRTYQVDSGLGTVYCPRRRAYCHTLLSSEQEILHPNLAILSNQLDPQAPLFNSYPAARSLCWKNASFPTPPRHQRPERRRLAPSRWFLPWRCHWEGMEDTLLFVTT